MHTSNTCMHYAAWHQAQAMQHAIAQGMSWEGAGSKQSPFHPFWTRACTTTAWPAYPVRGVHWREITAADGVGGLQCMGADRVGLSFAVIPSKWALSALSIFWPKGRD